MSSIMVFERSLLKMDFVSSVLVQRNWRHCAEQFYRFYPLNIEKCWTILESCNVYPCAFSSCWFWIECELQLDAPLAPIYVEGRRTTRRGRTHNGW